jgi:hypothetical protein
MICHPLLPLLVSCIQERVTVVTKSIGSQCPSAVNAVRIYVRCVTAIMNGIWQILEANLSFAEPAWATSADHLIIMCFNHSGALQCPERTSHYLLWLAATCMLAAACQGYHHTE